MGPKRMSRRPRTLAAGIALVFALACASTVGAATNPSFVAPSPVHLTPYVDGTPSDTTTSYTPTGRIVADSGFRPWTDGLSFQNYGATSIPGVPVDLTPAAVQDLFGRGVCLSGVAATCVLLPQMRKWMDDSNAAVGGGHCYGFSLAALRMFAGLLTPQSYGAASTNDLLIPDNAPLQTLLAELWATQGLEAVQKAAISGRPSRLLAMLRRSLSTPGAETYTIAIYNKLDGHAITPFAIEDRGSGHFNLLVYDNNWPGVTGRIAFDLHRDRWSYRGSLNPADKGLIFSGDARHPRNLWLFPTTAGMGTQPCPHCGARTGAARSLRAAGGGYDEITLTGGAEHAHLLLTDVKGRQTGVVHGRLVNEIPGAEVVRRTVQRTGHTSPEPAYRVPTGRYVVVTVDGRGLVRRSDDTLTLVGPDDYLETRHIRLRSGERHKVVFRPGDRAMGYFANLHSSSSPEVSSGLTQTADGARVGWTLRVSTTTALRGKVQLNLLTEARGFPGFQFTPVGSRVGGKYRLRLERLGADGSSAAWEGVVALDQDVAYVPIGTATDPSAPAEVIVTGRDGHQTEASLAPAA